MATPQLYYKNGSSWQSAMLNSYPVGAIYCSTSSTNPGSIFGGGWAEITGAVLRGNKQAGVYSDSDTHILSTNEIPAHNHRWGSDLVYTGANELPCIPDSRYGGVGAWWYCWAINGSTNNTGGGASSYQQTACLQCLYVEKNFINLDVMPNGIR